MLRTDCDPELRVFDPVIRFLHWLTLFLVAIIFVLAFSIDFASSNEAHVALIQLHRSFGVAVWIVTLGRLVWRQFSRFPNWPASMPQAMRFAAHWSEYALYALLLTQPILGLLQTNARGNRVDLFFLGQLPALIGHDRPLAKQLLEVHETVGLLLLGLIVFHALAALYHHFWRRDETLEAMLPQGMRRGAAQARAHESGQPDHRPRDLTPENFATKNPPADRRHRPKELPIAGDETPLGRFPTIIPGGQRGPGDP
jgi:cytochrome b561